MRRSLIPSLMLLTLALAACSVGNPSQLGLTGASTPQPPQPGVQDQLGTPGLNLQTPDSPSLVPHPANEDDVEGY
jgi:hypothetical protein